jgi:hypothetical protein
LLAVKERDLLDVPFSFLMKAMEQKLQFRA